MPVRPEAHTIHGGCNCKAIRYTLSIPAASSRIEVLSTAASRGQGSIRYPLVVTDSCNDCRRATGSVLPMWILSPVEWATFDLLLRRQGEGEASERIELPAAEAFRPGPKTEGTFVRHYASSESAVRTFCDRCGTNLTYAFHPMPDGMRTTLDVVLGTVDRADLESLRPDRHLWWDSGIEWTQTLLLEGDRSLAQEKKEALPRHPTYKLEEFVE